MAYTRRYFMEVTSLDSIDDEKLAGKLEEILPRTFIKLHRSSIVEVKKKC